MISVSAIQSLLFVHIAQFTIAALLVALAAVLMSRKWPHAVFMLCMLALFKCLVPPVITSPAGLFTRSENLAFAPAAVWEPSEAEVVRWKQNSRAGGEPTFVSSAGDAQGVPAMDSGVGAVAGNLGRAFVRPLFVIWALGAGLMLVYCVFRLLRLRTQMGHMVPAPERVTRMVEDLRAHMGVTQPVDVQVSEANLGPACLSFRKSTLVVPRIVVDRFSDRLLRPVLAHELVHAKRGDSLWGCLQCVTQIIWWFHPLVWWIGRSASRLCERCCDNEVVSTAGCAPVDYAESLVNVLSIKHSIHRMPLAHGMSASQITRQRLERIMASNTRPSRCRTAGTWALCGLFAVLLIPGMHWANTQQIESQESSPSNSRTLPSTLRHSMLSTQFHDVEADLDRRARVEQALDGGHWAMAIGLLGPHVSQNPDDAGAVFYLGYALHADGQLDEALRFHMRAADFPSTRAAATYNWACALALMGEHEEAIDKLREAIERGFVARAYLDDDQDLDSLRGLPAFQQLANEVSSYDQLDGLEGTWRVQDARGRVIGHSTIAAHEKGHLIVENWTGSSGGTSTAIRYFQPETKHWKQTWISDDGDVIELEGRLQDGAISLKGTMGLKLRGAVDCRARLKLIDANRFSHSIECFDRELETWEPLFEGVYFRSTKEQTEAPQDKELSQKCNAESKNA